MLCGKSFLKDSDEKEENQNLIKCKKGKTK